MNMLFTPRQAQFVHSQMSRHREQFVRMSIVAERLSARIQELRIPIREAARRCGLAADETEQRKFHHYVSGRNDPDTDTVLKICAGLKMSPNELYGFKPAPAALSADEATLLEKYRALSITQRMALLTLITVTQDIAVLPFTGT
jgi:hypothetical protein